MLLSLAFLSMGGIKTVALLTDVGIFAVYLFINAAVIWLRYKEPRAKRTFRSPLSIGRFPVLALLGILSAGFMLLQFEPVIILYELMIAVAGLILYGAFTEVRRLHRREKLYGRFFRKHLKHRHITNQINN